MKTFYKMFRYKFFIVAFLLALCLFGAFYLKLFLESREILPVKLRLLRDEVFLRRRSQMADVCSLDSVRNQFSEENGYQTLALNPHLLRNILVNDKHKFLYCYVPKVACTNWKKILLLLNNKNFTELNQIPADSVHRENVFLKLSDLQGQAIVDRLKTYDKFLFVRHPIERMLSAYRNKFVMNYTSSAYFKQRFGVAILKKFRKNKKISPKGNGVKFSEFVQYMIQTYDRDPKLLNEHWAPFMQLCHPCDIRYNLIGKYETLKKDAEYILEEINAPSQVKFPSVVPSKTSSLVDSYVSSLTNDQFRGLMRVYEKDFKMFDYHYRRKTDEENGE